MQQVYMLHLAYNSAHNEDTVILNLSKIEGKAMIRNRYNYPTPSIRDIKGKETQTWNN